MNIGRCIPEIIRIIQSLQMADCSKGSTPANWTPGNPVINSSPQTFSELQQRINEIDKNKTGMSWYLSFKEPSKECENKVGDK